MVIKVLGSGCANCQKLDGLAKKAVDELGIDAEIVKVTEYRRDHGVRSHVDAGARGRRGAQARRPRAVV